MATNTTDYFWTDIEQAQERLTGALVIYDGQPVLVQDVIPGDYNEDTGRYGTPKAIITPLGSPNERSRKILSSEKFNRFRELPKIGWTNVTLDGVGAVFVMRKTVTQRIHGLVSGNTTVFSFRHGAETTLNVSGYTLAHIMHDKGFKDAHNGIYPSLDRILSVIAEGTAIAYSRVYCVMRDNTGIRWLYRNASRVGLFTGADTLLLLTKFSFLREEIMEDEAFTLNNIRDF